MWNVVTGPQVPQSCLSWTGTSALRSCDFHISPPLQTVEAVQGFPIVELLFFDPAISVTGSSTSPDNVDMVAQWAHGDDRAR